MKRAFTHKVESVPSCGADKDALAKLSEGKLPGEVVNTLKPPAPEGNRRVRTSAAMIGLAISMGAVPLLLPGQGDEAIAAEPTGAEPIVSTPTASEAAVVSPSVKVEQQNAPSKQPIAEPQATTASLQLPIAPDNKVPFGQKLGQESTTYKLDAAPMATANGFKSSLVGTETQVLRISTATRFAAEIKPANTAVQQSDKVQSTQLQQSVLPSVVASYVAQPATSSTIPALQGEQTGLRENKGELLPTVTLSGHLPVGQSVVSPTQLNDILKASQDEALKRLKQQPNRVQNSLVEWKSQEYSNISASTKLETAEFNPPLLLLAFTNLDFEAKQPVVALPEPVAMPNPVITSTQSQEKPMTVASPVVMRLPQTMATIPVAAQQETTMTNLVIDPVKTSATSATLAVPKPVVVEPQATAVPERLYQVKPGDTIEALAQTYGVSPTEILRRNHLENPNLIQVNQALRIPPTNTTTIISHFNPTSSDTGISTSQYPVTVPSQAVSKVSTSVIPAVLKQPLYDTQSATATPAVATTLVATEMPKTMLLVASEPSQPASDTPDSQNNSSTEKQREAVKVGQQSQETQAHPTPEETKPTAASPIVPPSNNTKAPDPNSTINQASAPANSDAILIPVISPSTNTKAPAKTRSANQASAPAPSNATKIPVLLPLNSAKTPAQNNAPAASNASKIPVWPPLNSAKTPAQNNRTNQASAPAASNAPKIPVWPPFNNVKTPDRNQPARGDNLADAPTKIGVIPIPVPKPLLHTKPQEQNQPAVGGSQSSSTVSSTHGAIANPVPTPLNMPKPQVENVPTGGDAQPDSALPANFEPIPIQVPPPKVATAPTEPGYYNPNMQTPTGETVTPQLPGSQGPNTYPQLEIQGYMWPAKGVVTSGFGMRWGRMHKGIDIAAPIGTPIFASAPGVVVYAGWNSGGYGNLVDIQHPDGSLTRYAHNSRVLVQVGQGVQQGQEISEMGSTGHSTGPHCHFEVHPPGKGAVNPIAYLPQH